MIKSNSGNLPNGFDTLVDIKNMFLKQTDDFISNPALAAIIFSEEIFQNDEELSNLFWLDPDFEASGFT